jgi:polysaccharide pyruvyl transferase WcaK-like protein
VRAATYKRRVGWIKGLKAGLSDLNHPLRRARAASDLRRTRPAAEILREIATCRGLVAGRFHAMCLSLLADTPFAAMQSNTLKTKGLLADAGLVHRLAEDPVEALRLAPTWSDGERELAARFVSRARADASAMFREIASLAR